MRNAASAITNDAENIGVAQNLRHLPMQYGSSLDPTLASTDAFYALSELLSLATASESQFLNMMQIQIKKAVGTTHSTMEDSLETFNRMNSLLDDHIQYLQSTLEAIRDRAVLEWPKVVSDFGETGSPGPTSPGPSAQNAPRSRNMQAAQIAAENVISDLEYLLRLAESLANQCFKGSQVVLNTSMLEESRKSIRVTEYAARLSFLAFLFLPLTFTTGFFGMNFREFGQGDLSLWIFSIVLVPVMLLVGVVTFWNRVRMAWRLRFKSLRS